MDICLVQHVVNTVCIKRADMKPLHFFCIRLLCHNLIFFFHMMQERHDALICSVGESGREFKASSTKALYQGTRHPKQDKEVLLTSQHASVDIW